MNRDAWVQSRVIAVTGRMPAAYRGLQVEGDAVLNWCRKVLVNAAGPLVLQGPKGTGKTGNAWATWPHLIGCGWIGTFRGVTEVDYLESCFSDKPTAERARHSGVMLLDDVGGAPINDWARSRLLSLIDARWLAGHPTIVTTNLTEQQLAEHLGDRASSRLASGATVVTLTGADRRLA